MEIDPQQEIFSKLLTEIKALGYDVYDGCLPPDGTPYPFVYLGNFRQSDEANKTAVFGAVYGTIHVWSNTPKNRGTISRMMLEIKKVCRKIEHTENFSWYVRNMGQRIIPDTTTKQPLLHGVIEPEFRFS